MSELVKKSRAQFRSANGISEDKYIIYVHPGYNSKDVKFSFKSFKDGLSKFFNKD